MLFVNKTIIDSIKQNVLNTIINYSWKTGEKHKQEKAIEQQKIIKETVLKTWLMYEE